MSLPHRVAADVAGDAVRMMHEYGTHAERGASLERPAPLRCPCVQNAAACAADIATVCPGWPPCEDPPFPPAACATLGGELYRAPRLCTSPRAFGNGRWWVASCGAVLGRGRYSNRASHAFPPSSTCTTLPRAARDRCHACALPRAVSHSPGIGADLLPPTQLRPLHQVSRSIRRALSKFHEVIHHLILWRISRCAWKVRGAVG
jgi:hypothetical protein